MMFCKDFPRAKVFSFTKNDVFIEKDANFYEILKQEVSEPTSSIKKKLKKNSDKVLTFWLNFANKILEQIRLGNLLKQNKKVKQPFC